MAPELISQPTPEELMVKVSRRDRAAFADLYDLVAPMVFGLALRITRSRVLAEEVAQEVFIQIWQESDRFDPARGTARSWVATIAHRRAVDMVRRMQASSDREAATVLYHPTDADVAEEVVEDDERARVRAALSGLTELQRQAIELAYFGGLSYREVAEHIDAPLGTVKTRMRDGLARIRAFMEDSDG